MQHTVIWMISCNSSGVNFSWVWLLILSVVWDAVISFKHGIFRSLIVYAFPLYIGLTMRWTHKAKVVGRYTQRHVFECDGEGKKKKIREMNDSRCTPRMCHSLLSNTQAPSFFFSLLFVGLFNKLLTIIFIYSARPDRRTTRTTQQN